MFMQTRLFWLLSIALLVLWGSLTQASAQAPLSSDKTSTGVTALTATSLPFQGNLYNAGEPINGACDLKFTLYDSAQSGSKVGSRYGLPKTATSGRTLQRWSETAISPSITGCMLWGTA